MVPTIFAPATAPGRAGVAVIRISGPAAGGALTLLAAGLPPPRRARRARITDPRNGDILDDALVLWFPAPASFTGEDVAELHLHGGRAVTAAVIEALAALPNFRVAEPGEFTRRAFDNGKLDLTAAEAIADLVDAETAAQRRQALRQMDGALAELVEGWRERLLRALAHLEAEIDFPDEDLPDQMGESARPELSALAEAMGAALADGRRGERLRDGLHVAIVGAPNAGKSSLLNALARREAAIVTPLPGTTRDVIEVRLDLGGCPLILADTAGLRDSVDLVEAEGVRRARARAESADLTLAVFDATAWPALDAETLAVIGGDALVVFNKADLCPLDRPHAGGHEGLVVSALTGVGLVGLEERLAHEAAARLTSGGTPALTRARHRAALEECRAALLRGLAAPAPELLAEDARLATRALGRITGRVDVEEVLDRIFSEFCIGK